MANDLLKKAVGTVEGFYDTERSIFNNIEGKTDALLLAGAGLTRGWLPDVSSWLEERAKKSWSDRIVEKEKAGVRTRAEALTAAVDPRLTARLMSEYDNGHDALQELNLGKITGGKINYSARDLANNVANQLPDVLLNIAIPGSGLVGLGMSAAGNSAVEALNEGANLGQAIGYGAASGALEVGTEKLSDMFGLFGGGITDKFIPKPSTLVGKLGLNALGEAGEEMISEAANPFIKKIYKPKAIYDAYGTWDNTKQQLLDIATAGVGGAAVSFALAPMGSLSRNAQINDAVETLNALDQREIDLDARGKLTDAQKNRINERRTQTAAQITRLLADADADTRAQWREAFGPALADFSDVGEYQRGNYERAAYQTEGANRVDLVKAAEDSGVQLTTEIDNDAQKTFSAVKDTFAKVKRRGGMRNVVGLAIVEEMQDGKPFTVAGETNGKVIFINKNRMADYDDAMRTLFHETTHNVAASPELVNMLGMALKEERFADIRERIRGEISDAYDFDAGEIDTAIEKFKNREDLSKREADILDEYLATFNEYVLGTEGSSVEESVRRLTRYNDGLLAKAWNTIRDAIEMRSAIDTGDAEAVKAYKDLLRYEKVFRAALEARGADLGTMTGRDEEEEIRYSIKFDGNTNENERKEILRIVNENIEKVSEKEVFNEKSVDIRNYKNKSDYVLEVFDKQGGYANNNQIGVVELVKSGARSTMLHGFGKAKIAAIPAIKTVIENGQIVGKEDNYKNKGYDRYIIASRGRIDGKPAILGVVVKSYNGVHNNKFYLHEVEIIEADVSSMTAPQLSVDTVNTSASKVSIAQEDKTVNTSEQNSSEKVFQSRKMNTDGMTAEQIEAEKLKRAQERARKAEERQREAEQALKDTAFDYAQLQKVYRQQNSLIENAEDTADILHAIFQIADRVRGYNDRNYARTHDIPVSVNLIENDEFKKMAEKITQLFREDVISPVKVRENVYSIASWFNESNPIFMDYIEDITSDESGRETAQRIFDGLNDAFSVLAEAYDDNLDKWSASKLEVRELEAVRKIMSFVEHFYLNYDALYEDGKRVGLTEKAKQYFATAEKAATSYKGKPAGWYRRYANFFSSPEVVAQWLDAYDEDGFFTHYVDRFQRDSWRQALNTYNLTNDVNTWIQKHKAFRKHLTKDRIDVYGHKILVNEAIDLVFMASQDNGRLTLSDKKGGGFTYTTVNGTQSKPFFPGEEGVKAIRETLLKDADTKEYMKKVWKIYQEGGKFKAAADIARMGFTDVRGDGKYYQLTRDRRYIRQNVGDPGAQIKADMQSVFNLKINKKRSAKAKAIPLSLSDVHAKMNEYVRQVTMYEAFGQDVSNFNKLYNKNVAGKDGLETIRLAADKALPRNTVKGTGTSAEEYFKKYLNDVQGIRVKHQKFTQISKLRGNYAQAALGANPKVVVGQFASYPTAMIYLSPKELLMGAVHKTDYAAMDEYSMITKVRNADGVVVKAQSVTDQITAVGAIGGLGISWADRVTIGKIWNACQYHIEATTGYEFGSKENMKAAGELLDRVVTETQPTYQAADRSAFQRSDNEIVKAFSMFTSVPMKQISLFFSSVNRLLSYRAQKAAGYTVTEEQMSKAKKTLGKTVGSIVAANAMYVALVQLVRHILRKDEPEDNDGRNKLEQMRLQFVETTVSMFPILKEFYGKFGNGYDVDISVMGAVNDMLDAIDGFKKADSVEDWNKWLKNIVLSAGNITGVPARNLYNTIYGLVNRFDRNQSTITQWDSLFTENKNYTAKLAEAVENGDTGMVDVILRVQSGMDGLPSAYQKLIMKGYDVLPRSVGKTFTFNGETYTMSAAERKRFKTVYNNYSRAVSNMTRTTAYRTASDDARAAAIRTIQNTYWQLAIDEITGENSADKMVLFSEAIDLSTLAIVVRQAQTFKADVDRSGKTIAGSKKKKTIAYVQSLNLSAAQKYMIMGYLGYQNTNGKAVVKNYINSLKALSKEEKERLLVMSGYAE